jgi:hypothetical protein
MVHEVPNPATLFTEFRSILSPGGAVLYSEPKYHVTEPRFQEFVSIAMAAGLKPVRDMHVRWSRTKLFEGP